jgi:CRISPR-associated endonuclease/helicase Cas3
MSDPESRAGFIAPQRPIAHRRPDDDATHDLEEHLCATARLAAAFAGRWGASEAAALSGLWHDLGKYAPDFQTMIRSADPQAHLEGVPGGPRRRIDHSSAGALLALERFGDRFGRLLAYPIAGHHSGLPDWIGDGARWGLKDRLANKSHLARARSGQPPATILNYSAPTSGIPCGADPGLWVRMLASALFDADFLDAEAFFNPAASTGRGDWPRLASLVPKLERHLAQKLKLAEASAVNRIRAEVLKACQAAADSPVGLFSLTVPTGGGKTLSSLAFALEHARNNDLSRVIYAVPFTSIAEQTAQVFRQAVGSDAVLEHHSALGPRPDQETARSRLAGENWDAPLIVTTTVQLFESLFANRTSQLRKIHNLAGSVLVLDEAQALPPGVLRPITAVLEELHRYYQCSVVLCTATQPALSKVFRRLSPPREIAPNPPALFKALDRIETTLPRSGERQKWDDIASDIRRYRQALVIVNTRRDCRLLHGMLPHGTIHLSTRLCAAHRRMLLWCIRRRLARGEELRVVSTSLVEAGVDIDFPVVFRAMAGLDSLAQAAGRCNRNGRLAKGRFVVFRPEGTRLRGYMVQAVEAAEAALRKNGESPFELAAFERFFHELYWAQGEEARDKYRMAELLGIGIEGRRKGDPFDFRFRTAAERFRMIEQDEETLIVPYDRTAREAIEALRRFGPSRHLLRRLQPFTVPIERSVMAKLRGSLAVEDLGGVTVLKREAGLYDDDVGLDVERLGGPGIEDLIL